MQPQDAIPKTFPQDWPCLGGKTNLDAGKPTPKTASRVGVAPSRPQDRAVLGSATGRPQDCMVRNNPNKRVDADYEEKPTAKLSIPNWTPVEDVVRARPGGPYRAAVSPGGSRLLGLDRAGPCVTRGCMTALSLAQAAYLATMAANNAMQSSSKECRDKIAKQRYPIILKELTNIGGPCQWDARNSSWTIEKSMEFRPKESDIRRRGAEHVLPAVRNRVGPVCARVIGCTPPGWPSGKNMEAMQEELLDALYQEALPNIQAQLKKQVDAKAAAVKTEPGVDPHSARGAWAMPYARL